MNGQRTEHTMEGRLAEMAAPMLGTVPPGRPQASLGWPAVRVLLGLLALLTVAAAAATLTPGRAHADTSYAICYQAHVQTIGWQATTCNGSTAGTTGQGLRLEAVRIWLPFAPQGVGVCYQVHVQNLGWQQPACNGQVAGTTGQGLRVEAIRIWLTNPPPSALVSYQAHVQNLGWQPWVTNGAVAGTTGQALRLEALHIVAYQLN